MHQLRECFDGMHSHRQSTKEAHGKADEDAARAERGRDTEHAHSNILDETINECLQRDTDATATDNAKQPQPRGSDVTGV